jgi:hypothetical protein
MCPLLAGSRFQRPCSLMRKFVAARLLKLWARIPLGAWMFVCCECCVLSGWGLGDELIIRPEEFYRLWCVAVYDLEISWMRRPWPNGGRYAKYKQTNKIMADVGLVQRNDEDVHFTFWGVGGGAEEASVADGRTYWLWWNCKWVGEYIVWNFSLKRSTVLTEADGGKRPNMTLLLHKWLAPSLQSENSAGQKPSTAL